MNHIKTYQEHLNEGLIKTVDMETFDKHVRKLYKKFPSVPAIKTPDLGDAGHMNLMIYNNEETLKFIEELIHQMNVHGYFVSTMEFRNIGNKSVEKIVKSNDEFLKTVKDSDLKKTKAIQISLEPKFEEETKDKFTTLYHITEQKHVKKITEIGLVPRAKSKISYHPERIYLATKHCIADIYDMYKNFVEKPVILRIDVAGIKLYPDINVPSQGAYFATENIPPDKIHVIKEKPSSFISGFKKTKAGKQSDKEDFYGILDNLLLNSGNDQKLKDFFAQAGETLRKPIDIKKQAQAA